jgi:hypothetical protein
MLEMARLGEGASSSGFELVHRRFHLRWSVFGLPSVILDVELGVIVRILTVPKLVSDANVSAESFKVDGISVLSFEGDTVSESESKGIENRRFDAGRVLAQVVYFKVFWRGVESSFREVGKKKFVQISIPSKSRVSYETEFLRACISCTLAGPFKALAGRRLLGRRRLKCEECPSDGSAATKPAAFGQSSCWCIPLDAPLRPRLWGLRCVDR